MDVGDRVIPGVISIGRMVGIEVRVASTGTITKVEVAETLPSMI